MVSTGVAATAGLAGCITGASDGEFPNESIEVIVPFGEGSSTDVLARQIVPLIGEQLGVDAGVRNVPGSASLRGTQEAINADPDGHTLLMFNPPSTPTSYLINEPDFDIQELEGVGTYAVASLLLVANPDYGVEPGVEDLISRYEAGEMSQWAGQVEGSFYHVVSLFLRENMDVPWETYVGYDGNGPATESVVSDENPAGVSSAAATVSFTDDDRLDVLATLASFGDPAYPDVPAITDLGYDNVDFLTGLTRCLWAPPGTPDDVLDELTAAVEGMVQSDEMQQYAEENGVNLQYEGREFANDVLDNVVEEVPANLDMDAIREQALD
ncbi:Bug family tripartite tricarboxylate transporter substrate binding protein [Natrarchaeobius sp. A-rgal3]|uniref:Bug family tripartite tricarboxylate transporter substrate binding protein n=1 Tax=Natrarchaeobius versutus TaxID=1679078 RepID=UPI003510AFC8